MVSTNKGGSNGVENANRSRIIQAARDLFNSRGYRSVTINDLAERLGMSKKTIYQAFASKEEIAEAVVEETMERIDQATAQSKFPASEPLAAIKGMLIYSQDEQYRFGPMFLMDIEKYLPELAKKYKRFREGKKRSVEQLLSNGKQIGAVREDVRIPDAVEVLSICLKALARGGSANTKAIDLFLTIFCSGIAASSSQSIEGNDR
jgi:AcrR family transcriptional regulator